jgi:uncharacterized membrane protein YhhN
MNFNRFQSLILVSAGIAILLDSINSIGFLLFKPLTSFLILFLPILFKAPSEKAYAKPIVIGLLFCLLGDTFLLFESYFVFGLSAFLIGHLFFLFAFVKKPGWHKNLILGLLLVIVKLNELLLPVVLYMTVIVLMSWQGWGLALNSKTKNLKNIGVGVSLFMVSDTLLAINKFYVPIPFSGIFILGAYWGAIYLIAKSTTSLP